MIKKRNTKLNAVLAEINEKFYPNSVRKVFSIKFITKTGLFIYLPRAIAVGLKANMKSNDLKAIQPVNINNEPFGHVYPIWIHAIIEFNDKPII